MVSHIPSIDRISDKAIARAHREAFSGQVCGGAYNYICGACGAWGTLKTRCMNVAYKMHAAKCSKLPKRLPLSTDYVEVDGAKIASFSPVIHRPKYPEGEAVLSHERTQNGFYGARAGGWCMWPNVWDGDLVMVRGIEQMVIEKGRDLKTIPLKGGELLRWNDLENRIVHVEIDGNAMIKRLRLNLSARYPQLYFACDNARMFRGATFPDADEGVKVLGVIELVIPVARDATALPIEIADEYERLNHRES